ncbi:cyclase [Solihabitans fulvus]|uniref:Cyclase n=1 Tax=Solihabitans fulvus TaxID=1892852 RepID=A0A5B2WJ70_9PSEU|nr:SRPBCC family protein [Solihabitans fulvus]KAA2250944.1 cyclase [Solihabitans fulvus]
MRRVIVRANTTEFTAAHAYQRISDFSRYPELTDAVRDVEIYPPEPDGGLVSEWTVYFRKGLLQWTERDYFDHDTRTITFAQLKGDFETFEGSWLVEPDGDGAVVTFDATFDLGIPSLAELLDPVAEATLRNNIVMILRGLLDGVEVVAEEATAAT